MLEREKLPLRVFTPRNSGMLRIVNPKPFLLRFAKPCCSPNRKQPSRDYYYDDSTDVVRWSGSADHPPAVLVENAEGPQTKKCDVEKGEDMKDRRMWP